MPLQPDMKLISVDDHLIEHATVWQDRLPLKYRADGPRIVVEPNPNGGEPHEVWHYEGRRYPELGLNAVAGRQPEDFGLEPVRYADMIPGCFDPKARLDDMDLDGVHAALCFPTFPHFAGLVFVDGEDKNLATLCVRAYNDFVIEEWCATAPDRFIPLIILPFWDPAESVREIHRTASMGARAISFPESGVPAGLPSFHTDFWDPVFSAAEETGMPLCMHFGSSGYNPITAMDAPFAVTIALFGCNSMYAMADLLFSPVFHRHPRLQILFAEGGIGWMPYLIERIDRTWERHRHYQNINKTVRPSDLFKRHITGCFISDSHGIANRHTIGLDRITWESDYPHSDSSWPCSRQLAEAAFEDVPDDEVRQMVELNARRLFNFP